jgi:chromosome segregation ATPase
MKTYLLAMGVAAALFSCNTKEKTRLEFKVDSLSTALRQGQKAELAMNEVGILLDSIDENRHALHTKITEGITYAAYISRLKDINTHIKDSEAKLVEVENALKNSNNGSSATIRRLKADLAARSQEIVSLQLDVVTLREQNKSLLANSNRKDSIISSRDEMIKLKNADVASLEGLVQDINDQNRIKVGNLYFAQAQALEVAAERTKFAPRKRKETRREALELYKLSFSLGNTDAEAKIQELEKKLG